MSRLSKSSRILLGLWIALPVLNWALDFFKGRYNNYKIFRSMFWHLVEQKNLYVAYPQEHYDFFFYGPSYSIVMAPFAIFPDIIGMPLWGLFNVLILYYGITQLKLKENLKNALLLLSIIELGNSIWAQQYNPSIAAFIILAFASVENEKDFQAPFWILLGTFTKMYGIVGMVFFLFSKHKGRFIAGCFIWAAVIFVLPMAISSPSYILQTYLDWYHAIIAKNQTLIVSPTSDNSVMGLFRSVFDHNEWPNTWFFAIGMPLLLAPLLRFSQYKSKHFRTLMLASLLMFVVLFSTASEHPTYVICIIGLFLWMVMQPQKFGWRDRILILFVLILTGLSPTFVFGKPAAIFVLSYALKALPCVVAWGFLLRDQLTVDFVKEDEGQLFELSSPTASLQS